MLPNYINNKVDDDVNMPLTNKSRSIIIYNSYTCLIKLIIIITMVIHHTIFMTMSIKNKNYYEIGLTMNKILSNILSIIIFAQDVKLYYNVKFSPIVNFVIKLTNEYQHNVIQMTDIIYTLLFITINSTFLCPAVLQNLLTNNDKHYIEYFYIIYCFLQIFGFICFYVAVIITKMFKYEKFIITISNNIFLTYLICFVHLFIFNLIIMNKHVRSPISIIKNATITCEPYDDVCPICMENNNDNYIWIVPDCKHQIHYSCVDEYLEHGNLNCPMCKKSYN